MTRKTKRTLIQIAILLAAPIIAFIIAYTLAVIATAISSIPVWTF